jgi:hypothetical protein
METLLSTTESLLSNTLSDLLTLSTSNNWESLKPKKGVSGFQKSQEGNLNLVKAEGLIEFPPEQVLSFMLDSSYKWDETLEESKVLHEFSPDLFIMYERYKCPWPVSDRDFVYGMKIVKREEALYIIAKSIETSHPQISGVVRGEIITSGYVLKRTELNYTQITYLVSLDPKGSIPKMVVRSLNKEQVANIWRIREFMQKIYN